MNEKPRILVLNDDCNIGELLKCILETYGMECIHTNKSERSWSILRNYPIDLIIQDIQRDDDGLDGIEFYRLLKKDAKLCRIPVMFLTGHGFEQLATISEKMLVVGDEYMSFPFDPDLFIFKVRKMLAT